jgi:hypothetical protein
MRSQRALQEFHRFLARRKLRAESLSVADGFEAMLAFFREVRATDVDLDRQGDMLLYQWGTYDWGKGRYFELDLTRQLIVGDGEDDDIWQLQLTYHFTPSPALDTAGAANRWCESLDDLDEMRRFILASPAYVAASSTSVVKVALVYECAG